MKSLFLFIIFFTSQAVFAANCGDTATVRNQALSIAKHQASQDSLLIGGRPTQFEVVKFTPFQDNTQDPDYFDTIVAKVEVVGRKFYGNESRVMIRVQLDLIDDVRHSCELQVASKEVLSAYRVCREMNGYNGRIGNAYDPCVE